jgi:uncharacterized membrane protein YphA (DoxX/SURF4 family)
MTSLRVQLTRAWWSLRVALGAGLLLAGLDKFANVLTDWSMYLSPFVERRLPVSAAVALRAAGVLEVVIGLALLSRWTRVAAYAASAWLAAVALNLALAGNFWDLVLRDLEIAVAAFTLGPLTAWRESLSPSRSPSGSPGGAMLHPARIAPATTRRTS